MKELEEKFIVINKKRFEEMLEHCVEGFETHCFVKESILNFENALNEFCGAYSQITGKELNQKYYVCNQDEPYAEQVLALILE